MPSSTIQERTGMGGESRSVLFNAFIPMSRPGHSLGKYETSTNTGMGGSFGQERMNLGGAFASAQPRLNSEFLFRRFHG